MQDKFNLIINTINYLRSLPSPPPLHAFVSLPLQSSSDPLFMTIDAKTFSAIWSNKETIS